MYADASFDFDDRVVLVTGATGALGSAVTEAFLSAGATVCGTARERTEDFPDPAHFYPGDLTDEAAAKRVVSDVVDEHGRLDFLCCTAGSWGGGDPVEETAVGTYESMMDVNLRTTFLACKHALPHLQAVGGSIVTTAATSALEGGSGDWAYRASKAGVRRLTESIAAENEGDVRANTVLPGIIDTPTNREAMSSDPEDWTDPGDIARTFLALCSDATPVTTGSAVRVDDV